MATAVSDERRRKGEQRDAFTLTPASVASHAHQAESTMRRFVYKRERSPLSVSCDYPAPSELKPPIRPWSGDRGGGGFDGRRDSRGPAAVDGEAACRLSAEHLEGRDLG